MIQHVALEVPRRLAEPCARFYALLGFAPAEVPPGLAGRAVWLRRAGTDVHLLFTERPVAAPQGHLALVVDDYPGTLEALRAAGHEPEARREHWGSPRSYVRDPAGHLVELMAVPPP